MKTSVNGVSSPRIPGSVSWIGLGFAVGLIVFTAAKRVIKGEARRRRGTAKSHSQPKAQMKSEPSKSANGSSGASKPATVAKSAAKKTKAVPATKTATPAGREEVRAQKDSAAKATQTPPRKRTSKVATPTKEKTTPGLNTNPKNPRTSPG